MKPLESIEEIKTFFKNNTTPIYYVGVSVFHTLGLERWIPNIKFISYQDSFDGLHDAVFSPTKKKERWMNLSALKR